MAIDIFKDDLMPISEVAKRFPGRNGKPRALNSIVRWIQRGARARNRGSEFVLLEAAKVGGAWYTTEDAVRQFSQQLTSSSVVAQPHPKQRKKHSKEHERATASLRARGMKVKG